MRSSHSLASGSRGFSCLKRGRSRGLRSAPSGSPSRKRSSKRGGWRWSLPRSRTRHHEQGCPDGTSTSAATSLRARCLARLAYTDGPLPIGEGQTISQPYIVAWMTELIEPTKKMRVLEIGTGSGYQAAVLAECVAEVDTIEVVPGLANKAKGLLAELGYRNVQVRVGDGYEGWPEQRPYDAILLTAAPPKDVPRPLLDQLKVGGRLVAPVGRGDQKLVRITRTATGFEPRSSARVRFVPMTGKAQKAG